MARWRYKNVTKSNAQYWPVLADLSIIDMHPRDLATLAATIIDQDADQEFDLKDELLVEYAEDGVTFAKVFAGDLAGRELLDMGRSDPRVWHIEAQDFTARLEDTVLEGSRPAETAATRLAWIMDQTPTHGLTLGDVSALTTMLEAHDGYNGMNKREAINEIAQELDALFYADFDKEVQVFVGTLANPAPFDLVHPANPPDSYPFWDFRLGDDGQEIATRVRVRGETSSVWRTNATAETALGKQIHRALDDTTLRTTAQMNRAGDTFLANAYPAPREGTLTISKPGIWGGMQVHVTHPSWSDEGVDDDFEVIGVAVEMLDPHDPDDPAKGGQAHFVLTIADRIRRAGKGPDVINTVTRRRPTPPAIECFDVFAPEEEQPLCNDVSQEQDFDVDVGPSPNPIILWMAYIEANQVLTVSWTEDGEIYKGIDSEYPWHKAFAQALISQEPGWTDPDVPPTVEDLPKYPTVGGDFDAPIVQVGGSYNETEGPLLGWRPFNNSTPPHDSPAPYDVTSGKWAVIWVQSARTCINVGHADYDDFPLLSSGGIRWQFTVELGSASYSCFTPTPEVIGQVCQGSVYGPVTLFPDESGVYTFPYPFVAGSLQVLVGGTWQVPQNIDMDAFTFELVDDPGAMIVQAYAQIPLTYSE